MPTHSGPAGRADRRHPQGTADASEPDPRGMQHLRSRASGDTDGVRDDLRDYVTIHLGDSDAVLDELAT
jgi:hypothetical protein